jgi:GTP-binding protein
MTEGNFVDYVKMHLTSGNGGQGSAHLHREKYIPKGGPDGGDGGRGGHVILRGNSNLWTLYHLKFKRHYKAGYGGAGSKQTSTGADGEEVIVEVPLGTVVRDSETQNIILEITEESQELIIARGGKGGLGNDHFKSPTNQAPKYSQTGKIGIEEWVTLELKVLADVGLVGFPNAGKSTLLSSISKAKPKIADYPFTTLTPNLGVVPYKDYKSFVVADIPGIIEGAAEGKGLGIRFLRHIERNSILLFIIPVDSPIKKEFQLLKNELKKYNEELLKKKFIIAISKCDLIPKEDINKINFKSIYPIVYISSVSNFGLKELKENIWKEINST